MAYPSKIRRVSLLTTNISYFMTLLQRSTVRYFISFYNQATSRFLLIFSSTFSSNWNPTIEARPKLRPPPQSSNIAFQHFKGLRFNFVADSMFVRALCSTQFYSKVKRARHIFQFLISVGWRRRYIYRQVFV